MDVDHALDRSCRCAFPCEEARNLLEVLARDSASTVLMGVFWLAAELMSALSKD
jgi:hypothetical protein